jgi:ribonucleoside-diphosphate reductase alpha chain
MESASFSKLTSMHFYAWQKGLKTGMYYLRSRPAADPIKFTLSAKHQRAKFAAAEEIASYATPSVVEDVPQNQITMSFSNIPTITAQDLSDAENFPKACSLDDPDCMACSA